MTFDLPEEQVAALCVSWHFACNGGFWRGDSKTVPFGNATTAVLESMGLVAHGALTDRGNVYLTAHFAAEQKESDERLINKRCEKIRDRLQLLSTIDPPQTPARYVWHDVTAKDVRDMLESGPLPSYARTNAEELYFQTCDIAAQFERGSGQVWIYSGPVKVTNGLRGAPWPTRQKG